MNACASGGASWSQLRITVSLYSTGEEQKPWTEEKVPGTLRQTSLPSKS